MPPGPALAAMAELNELRRTRRAGWAETVATGWKQASQRRRGTGFCLSPNRWCSSASLAGARGASGALRGGTGGAFRGGDGACLSASGDRNPPLAPKWGEGAACVAPSKESFDCCLLSSVPVAARCFAASSLSAALVKAAGVCTAR